MEREYVEERGGGFYVKDTRVSLDSIVHAFRQGESPETILENFDTLTLEQVYGAITHYLAHQAAVDEYLGAQAARVAELRRRSEIGRAHV